MSFNCRIISLQYGFAHQSLRAIIHDKNQCQTIDDLSQVGGNAVGQSDKAEQLGQQNHEDGTQDGAFGIADATNEEGADDEDTFIKRETGGVDVTDVRGLDGASQSCHSCREKEGPRLELHRIASHGLDHRLICTNGVQDTAKG